MYNEKWITELKFPKLPRHSGDSERFIVDILDFSRQHDRTGTTITKWLKPSLYPTPASDQVLEYVAADSQGMP
eukprot:12936818-Prorocentrum_lima.AAC.1